MTVFKCIYLYTTAWLCLGVFLWLKRRHTSRDSVRSSLMKCFTVLLLLNWSNLRQKLQKSKEKNINSKVFNLRGIQIQL